MTWSILARDRATGELGAAVASRFLAAGALVEAEIVDARGYDLLARPVAE